MIGEDGALIGLAVAIGVFENDDARARRLARGRIVWIVQHLAHVDFAVFIERHLDGIEDQRLGGKKLDMEIVVDANPVQRFLGRQRRLVRMLARACDREKNQSNDGTNCKTGQPSGVGPVHYCERLSHGGVKVV